jgi:nitrogen fixation NifU-like protein
MDNLKKFVDDVQQEILEQARLEYSETVIDHWINPRHFGAMEDPDGCAGFTGPCGDSVQICLRVRGGVIVEGRFLTDGCATTIAAADVAVELAIGREIRDAPGISKELILQRLERLPPENEHCAFLAEVTLKAAVADFLRRTKPA